MFECMVRVAYVKLLNKQEEVFHWQTAVCLLIVGVRYLKMERKTKQHWILLYVKLILFDGHVDGCYRFTPKP